jgi:hypothetical protein
MMWPGKRSALESTQEASSGRFFPSESITRTQPCARTPRLTYGNRTLMTEVTGKLIISMSSIRHDALGEWSILTGLDRAVVNHEQPKRTSVPITDQATFTTLLRNWWVSAKLRLDGPSSNEKGRSVSH